MVVGINAINLIKESESLELSSYRDPVGIWTIGWGHTKTAKAGQTITVAQASALLVDDMQDAVNAVKRYVKAKLNQNQFDALVSWTFNLGSGNLKSSTLLKKINANPNDPAIALEFAKWIFAGGQKLNGLVTRRAREADLYFGSPRLKKKVAIVLLVAALIVVAALLLWKNK